MQTNNRVITTPRSVSQIKAPVANWAKSSITVALLAALLLFEQLLPVFAQGTAFTYHGRLNDNGQPANGNYDLAFSLFSAGTGGSIVAGPITNSPVTVSNGLFSALLDFGANFPGADRWLEIAARSNLSGAFTTLTPRQKLTPTPYAIAASNLTGNLPASQLSGTVANGNLPASPTFTGSVAASTFSGNGAGITNVNATTLGGYSAGNFWQTSGNNGTIPGANFLGTSDNQPLELKVSNTRALRLEPNATSPNLIGGHTGNSVSAGVVGATIGGGGDATRTNKVTSVFGTIGGGVGNSAGQWGFVGGGEANAASGSWSTVAGGVANSSGATLGAVGGGTGNAISSGATYATIAGGANGTTYGPNSFIAGGLQNTIQSAGSEAAIGGGQYNYVNAGYAVIGGGYNNYNAGPYGGVAGGQYNNAYSSNSFVGGGYGNSAAAPGAFVGGGGYDGFSYSGNTAGGPASAVAGGRGNTANGYYAGIGGGYGNSAAGYAAAAAGGSGNNAGGPYAAIGGGFANNAINNNFPTVAGGYGNTASAFAATVGGGQANSASGQYATVPGGDQNLATNNSFAAGHRGKAQHPGTFVWADSTEADFISSATNQFLIRAAGGVGIGKTNPATALDVNGTITAAGYAGDGSGLTNLPLSGLQSGSATNGQVLAWNGNTWSPASAAAGGGGGGIGSNYSGALTFTNNANVFNGAYSGNGSGLSNLNAVAKAGDTMTGALNLPANGLSVGSTQLVAAAAKVGVGTATPGYKLDIRGNMSLPAGSAGSLYFDGANASGQVWQLFHNASEPFGPLNSLVFYNAAAGASRVVLAPSGNVGIGTNTPATTLHVNGTVTAASFTGSGAALTGLTASSIAAGQVVKSVNGLNDNVTITVGPGVTLATNGNNIQISASRNLVFAKLGSDVTTTSTSYINTGLSLNLSVSSPGRALVTVSGSIGNSTSGVVELRVNRDSGAEFQTLGRHYGSSASNWNLPLSFQHLFTGLAAGPHSFSLEWRAVSGTALCNASTSPDVFAMRLSIEEIP